MQALRFYYLQINEIQENIDEITCIFQRVLFSPVKNIKRFISQVKNINFWMTSGFFCYRSEVYFCGFYRCVNSGESLTNGVKPESLYVEFVSDSPEFTHR